MPQPRVRVQRSPQLFSPSDELLLLQLVGNDTALTSSQLEHLFEKIDAAHPAASLRAFHLSVIWREYLQLKHKDPSLQGWWSSCGPRIQ